MTLVTLKIYGIALEVHTLSKYKMKTNKTVRSAWDKNINFKICCIKIHSYSTVTKWSVSLCIEHDISHLFCNFVLLKKKIAHISLPCSIYLLNILVFCQNRAVIFTLNTFCIEKHHIWMHLQGFLRFWKNLTWGEVSFY